MRALASPRALSLIAAAGCALGGCGRPRPAKAAAPATNPLVSARPYRIVAPPHVDPGTPLPLVVVLHGLGGSGERIEDYYQLDPLAAELGFLVAYPEGTEEARPRGFWGRHRRFWNATDVCCDFANAGVDDVAYLDAVIDDVSAHHRVDAKRIFVMGLSNGGYMAHRYACDRADRVAAIASQAGVTWSDMSRCKPSGPVAVLQIHGTDDDIVPYGGGRSRDTGEANPPSAHQSVADWVAFDKCGPVPDTSAAAVDLIADERRLDSDAAETTIEKWGGCRGVELWTMRGGRHVPHPNHPLWERMIYGWLAAHPKP